MEASRSRNGHPPFRPTTIATISSEKDVEKQRQLEEWTAARNRSQSPLLGPEGRAQPVIVLFSLIFLFLASAAGIAFFVLALAGVVIARAAELPSRIVVFAASVVGVVYTAIHLAAARTSYRKKEHGSPQIYGNYKHAMGLLLVRLSVPVWITAVVTAALAVANIEGALMRSFQTDPKQMAYVNLMIAAVGMFANLATLLCVETSVTPFATSLVSKSEFLRRRGKSSSLMLQGDAFEENGIVSQQAHYVRQSQQVHHVLNSLDRSNGSWPVQRSQSNASSVYSTQTQRRLPGGQGGDREHPRPGTAISTDVAAEPLHVKTNPFADGDHARPPIHMSWRPPSHHGKRSIDNTIRPQSSIAPPLPVTAVTSTAREPVIPSLPTASDTKSRDSARRSSSSSRTMWAPSATGHQIQMSGSRQSSGAVASAFQQAPSRPAQTMPQAPALPLAQRPQQNHRKATPEQAGSSWRATATPSPRSRPLRSHPPFASPAMGGRSSSAVIRPSTAPGLPPSTIENWGVPQHNFSVKRKPVGHVASSSEADRQPTVDDGGYSSSCYDEDDDSDSTEDEMGVQEGLTSGISRTQRRLMKQKGKDLKRSNTNNFSRPLPRSRSLVSMHRRTFSDHDQFIYPLEPFESERR